MSTSTPPRLRQRGEGEAPGAGGGGGRPLEEESFEDRSNFYRGRQGRGGDGSQLPSKQFPFLNILGLSHDWVMKNVDKDYVPLGAKKRMQAVIETVYLHDPDEDLDEELTLDDLEAGNVSWLGFKEEVKIKASEISARKEADETFRELPDEKIPLGNNMKYPVIKAEEEGEDDYGEFPSSIQFQVQEKTQDDCPKIVKIEEVEDEWDNFPKIIKVEGALSSGQGQIDANSLGVSQIMESTTSEAVDLPTGPICSNINSGPTIQSKSLNSQGEYVQIGQENSNDCDRTKDVPSAKKRSSFHLAVMSTGSEGSGLVPIRPTSDYSGHLGKRKYKHPSGSYKNVKVAPRAVSRFMADLEMDESKPKPIPLLPQT